MSDRACSRAAPPQPPAPQTAMPTVQAASSGAAVAGPAAGAQGALPAAARAAGEADQAAESPSSGTSADSNSSVTMAMENLTTQQASAAAPLGRRKMFTFTEVSNAKKSYKEGRPIWLKLIISSSDVVSMWSVAPISIFSNFNHVCHRHNNEWRGMFVYYT